MTKNQLFKLIERQIEISRFEAHIRRELLKRLAKLQRQVKGRIGEEDLTTIGKRDLNKLIKDIETLSVVAHKELIETVDNYAFDLAQNETDFIYREFSKSWEVPENRPLPITPLILGLTTAEWLSKQANDYAHSVKMSVRNNDSIDHLERQLGYKTKAFTTTLTRSVSQQTQTNIAEKSKKVKGYWHVSVLDSKTSDICLVRSNKRWAKDETPIDHNLPIKHPPLHPHCRSILAPVTDVSKEPATMTVEEWLDSMTEKQQDKILGKGKAQMYRKGHITLRDLLDQSGRPRTLTELERERYPDTFIEPRVDTKLLKGVRFQSRQLQRKYKHAEIFEGIEISKPNPKNWKLYQNKIIEHLNDENTEQFGTYLYSKNSKVYYNRTTGIAVVINDKNNFLTAYIPSDDIEKNSYQLTNYLKTGGLR